LSASVLPSISETDRGRARILVVLVLAGVAVWLIVELLSPFLLGIVTATVFATLANPLHEPLSRRLGRPWLSSLLLTAAIFLGVVVPLFTVGLLIVNGVESGLASIVNQIQEFVEQRGQAWNWMARTASVFGIGEDELATAMGDQLSGLGNVVAGGTLGLLSGIGGWLVQGAIALFTLFYLLRDGAMFTDVLRWLIPLDDELTDAVIHKTTEVVFATVLGTLVVAAVQGSLGGLLFWALGLPGPALWGTVMAFFSILPAVGPPVVWVPAAVILAATDQVAKAAILVAVGLLVVGTVDNVLRAVLVGQRARLHSLVVFFSVLGGLVVFGAAGFLLGPIVVVVAFSVVEIAWTSVDISRARSHASERQAILPGVPLQDKSDEAERVPP
jgi:predicted PurR-regulated permease PerM